MTTEPQQKKELFHFVPDEICIVVSLDRAADERDADRVHRRLYDGVLDWLSKQVPSPDDVDRLRPLRRAYVDPESTGAMPPWVSLPRRGGTTALYFYGVGSPPDTESPPSRERARTTQALVQRINDSRRRLVPLRVDGVQGSLRLDAATPNWLIGPAPSGIVAGGPGTTPDLETTTGAKPFAQFRFNNQEIEDLVTRQRDAPELPDNERGVVVAVLDTSPTRDTVAATLGDLQARGVDNWLLEEVARHVNIDLPLFVPPDYFTAHLADIEPNFGARQHDGTNHLIPDHGLFAAGIIRDIAPTAQINLVRVLDDKGIGDLLLLARILREVPRHEMIGGRRLVINLSLTADVPIREMLQHFWPLELRLKEAEDDEERIIHRALAEVIDWLREEGVLVVAAAGNDFDDVPAPLSRPEPRLPARYDSVLGVAAVNRDRRAASFSNQGDFVALGNGVAVYGGDTPAGGLADDGVIGVFSAPEMPFAPPGTRNTTGWARWSGTSFAAPVVSAIAAALWTEEPGLRPAEIIERISKPSAAGGLAELHVSELDCHAIVAKQQ